jgi:hypothetical protein
LTKNGGIRRFPPESVPISGLNTAETEKNSIQKTSLALTSTEFEYCDGKQCVRFAYFGNKTAEKILRFHQK